MCWSETERTRQHRIDAPDDTFLGCLSIMVIALVRQLEGSEAHEQTLPLSREASRSPAALLQNSGGVPLLGGTGIDQKWTKLRRRSYIQSGCLVPTSNVCRVSHNRFEPRHYVGPGAEGGSTVGVQGGLCPVRVSGSTETVEVPKRRATARVKRSPAIRSRADCIEVGPCPRQSAARAQSRSLASCVRAGFRLGAGARRPARWPSRLRLVSRAITSARLEPEEPPWQGGSRGTFILVARAGPHQELTLNGSRR